MKKKGTVLFIPHGGGPLPILGDLRHKEIIKFLKNIKFRINKPSSIIIISAHWEEDEVNITSGEKPSLIYDYYKFPEEAYKITYPALGNSKLANKINNLLKAKDINSKLNPERGFDHGVFIPLKIMYPDASITCVQISLLKNLDPKKHIEMGKALSSLMDENILILGSGMSFHNLNILLSGSESTDSDNAKNKEFDDWLVNVCAGDKLNNVEKEKALIEWIKAPSARFCHPREEHLIPLHVCYGIKNKKADLVFNDNVIGKKVSAFLW
jgi:aromatic ring-opening dioxygenase catalytic subunit (LigB family)